MKMWMLGGIEPFSVGTEQLVAPLRIAAAKDAVRLLDVTRSGLIDRVLERHAPSGCGSASAPRRSAPTTGSAGVECRAAHFARAAGMPNEERGRQQQADHAASAAAARARAYCRQRRHSAPPTVRPPPCACAGAPAALATHAAAPRALTRLPAWTPALTASSPALTKIDALSPSVSDQRHDDDLRELVLNRVRQRASAAASGLPRTIAATTSGYRRSSRRAPT